MELLSKRFYKDQSELGKLGLVIITNKTILVTDDSSVYLTDPSNGERIFSQSSVKYLRQVIDSEERQSVS